METPESVYKSIGQKDIVLFTVSAILLVDTLAASASIGPQSVFWWIFLGSVFFLPFGLISAELGCAYPEKGGIYAWVRNAFGARWGSRVSWSYWVNVAIWLPSIFIMFTGILKQLFVNDLSQEGQIAICILLTWIAVAANAVTLDIGKWIPNIGAVFKIVIFITIILGAASYVLDNGMANPLTFETMRPDWQGSLQFIPAIVYGMLGFELISAEAEEIDSPETNLPRALLISGLVIISLYTLGTVAILAAIPVESIDLVEGLVDTLSLFLGGTDNAFIWVSMLGVMVLYTFFSNAVTWSMGSNRAAAEAAQDGELAKVFSIHSKRGTPIGAAVLMGVVSTVILVSYGFLLETNENLFWSLFSFSGVVFLWPYIAMVLAFAKMRLVDLDHPRPFKIWGGYPIALTLTLSCICILSLSIFLFIYSPSAGIQWPVLIGAATAILLGEFAIKRNIRH